MDVISDLGGVSAVAKMVRCRPSSVTEWRQRGVPPERCPQIERESAGRFPCELLRPDLFWVRVPDALWPWHPDGRPAHDLAAPYRLA